jgi:hypothetical protein
MVKNGGVKCLGRMVERKLNFGESQHAFPYRPVPTP